MGNFGVKEKKIAVLLSNFPRLKKIIKKNYQRLTFLFNRKNYQYNTLYPISLVDDSSSSSFFGYYDKSPENVKGDKIIYYRTTYDTKQVPTIEYPIQIILKCLKTDILDVIDNTYAYNWQQGSKMMWLNNEEFIYNFYSKELNEYKSKIYNTILKTYRVLDLPIYDCFEDKTAYCINYSRLMDLRPDYGYRNIKPVINYENYENDGIFKLSIIDNSYSLLISLKQLIKLNPMLSMQDAKHKVNHIMLSPDGSSFMFMHRWLTKSGKRYDRLLVSDSDYGKLKIVSDGGMVSHCCWKDNDTIVGYLRHDNIDGFYKINLDDLSFSELFNNSNRFSDGHPTFNSNYMVFDSYPDKARMKKLYCYNSDDDEVILLGEFFEPFEFYNESRCDLHPRFNKNKSSIYIDSVHTGKRKLYKLSLN